MTLMPEFNWQLAISLLCVAVAISVLVRGAARTFRGEGGCSGCAGGCDTDSEPVTDAVTIVSEEKITIHYDGEST